MRRKWFAALVLSLGMMCTAPAALSASADAPVLTETVSAVNASAVKVDAPAGFYCSDASTSQVVMRWKKVSGVTGYEMQYYDKIEKVWTNTKRIGASSQYYKYSAKNMTMGITYSMRIRSYKISGGKTYYSSWAKTYATTDPEQVKGIKETSANTSGYTLKWNKAKGASFYEIFRWSPDTGKYEKIGQTENTYYKITDRTAGQKNSYKIRAARKLAGSEIIFHGVSTKFMATAVCDTVTGIKASARLNTVTVKWTKVPKATAYEVYYTNTSGDDPVVLATVGSKINSYTTSKLTPGKKYLMKVKAISTYGTVTVKSRYPKGAKVRVFNKTTYNKILDDYSNNSAITLSNGQGYTIPGWLKNNLSYELNCLGGTCSFVMLDLESGALVASNGKTYMGTASTVKMPFMLYCLQEMEDGEPNLDTVMTYTPEDYHAGSGIIQTYEYGRKLTIKQIFQTIFDYSDNIGFYMLQRKFGIDGYNKYIASLGCRTSMSYQNRWGVICATDSAKEWIQMYNYIYNGKYADYIRYGYAHSCSSNFRLGLNNKYTVYSKCGWTDELHHDTTVVEAEHPYVLICFTNRVSAARLQRLARAADAIHTDMWNYYSSK